MQSAAELSFSIEVVTLPVSDVDRSLSFYVEAAGFHLDVDYRPNEAFRVVQLTPPGSSCSIHLALVSASAPAESYRDIYLVVNDIQLARSRLLERGVVVSEIRHKTPAGAWEGSFTDGLDPERRDYSSFADFLDLDGNRWVLQERGYRVFERL